MPKPDTRETFIAKARQKHGTKYDYSHTVYTGSTQEVTIRCPEHGEFRQRPYDHLYGHGCSVHKKFSAKFATEVQWQKVDANGNEVSDDEEDITQGNDGPTPDPNEGGENEE